MTKTAMVYGNALYDLAKEEGLTGAVLGDLSSLRSAFSQCPEYLKLLSNPAVPKQERCSLLDQGFRGKLQPYVLNFLKLLTEMGYIRQFDGCAQQFRNRYNEDNGILPVTAVTASPMSQPLQEKLRTKLASITGSKIQLECRVDPRCLGGVKLDLGGRQLDGTVRHRLDELRKVLSNTVL